MPTTPKTEQERARDIQVGLVMKAYRESFPREKGGQGITQAELLRRMAQADPIHARRMSQSTVSRWESGYAAPTIHILETFGKALNLSETEIDGLILMSRVDPGIQDGRTLTCPQCGAETRTVRLHHRQSGPGGDITAVTRTRRCLGCGRLNESCEHWSDGPQEADSQSMQQILDEIEEANGRIWESLRKANTPHGPQAGLGAN